jgi:hypothetical protein
MTNQVTEKAMDFFYRDDEASKMLNELLESGKPARVIAEALQQYMNQLNRFELMGVYHQLQVHVIEATDWDEVANRALCDWYGAHSDNNC